LISQKLARAVVLGAQPLTPAESAAFAALPTDQRAPIATLIRRAIAAPKPARPRRKVAPLAMWVSVGKDDVR
jgi:hypothetical protein